MTASNQVARLQAVVNQQWDFLRAYKARQDRIVAGLIEVKKSLDVGDIELAREGMKTLGATDLKQAQERVANWTMALRLAEQAIRKCANTPKSRAAVEEIRSLAPEAFEDEKAGAHA